MNRFHVHVSVKDLDESIRFYSSLFGTPPSVTKPDYAKWMLEDPRINFALSKHGLKPGVHHLGVQVESNQELAVLRGQIAAAEMATLDQPNAECCYARSDKYWTHDPQGVPWETFHSVDSIPIFGARSRGESTDCCAARPRVASESTKSGACCD